MFSLFSKQHATEKQVLFQVPPMDPFENPLVETHPGELRQWATALPFANPEQLAEAVISSLRKLNRFPGPVKKREELMGIYQTPSTRLYHLLLDGKKSLPIGVSRQLMLEMAYGYLHIINTTLKAKSTAKQRKNLHYTIYYAIKFLSLEYLYACEEYDCRSGIRLRELIRLHTLAEVLHLQDEPITDADYPHTSISHQINLYLLLSLLDPCHLQAGESRVVFSYMSSFAHLARFEPLDSPPEPAGQYVIDKLGEVTPHLSDPSAIKTLSAPRFCLFNLIPVSQQLHQHLRSIEQQNSQTLVAMQQLGAKATANLLRRMLKSWHIRLERDTERHKTSGQAMLWFGLPTIHRFLTGEVATASPDNDSEQEISVTQDVGGLSNQVQLTEQKIPCWRFNQSRSGAALHLPRQLAATPQVGELVILAKPNASRHDEWKLGVIRRSLLRDAGVLEIGVQFINGRIVPLSLQPIGVEEEDEEKKENEPITLPALYIDQGNIERSSLLATRETLKVVREYRVEEMIPAPNISPVHLTEVTARYERFRVTRS